MKQELISELTMDVFRQADDKADKDIEDLFSQTHMEKVIKGEERSGWIGTIHVGLWETEEGELEKKFIIHTSFEGKARLQRNVEADKIKGFFSAKNVMNTILDKSRTVYTPAIKGHKVVYEDENRGILNREIYVNYEPRILAYNNQGISPEDYASFLGRDLARFMFTGVVNAPRHIRPNFCRDSIRKTCMIDMDQFDPRTFNWIICDKYSTDSLNYEVFVNHEQIFFHDVSNYFLDQFLPWDISDRKEKSNQFKEICFEGFRGEVKNLKGEKLGGKITDGFIDKI